MSRDVRRSRASRIGVPKLELGNEIPSDAMNDTGVNHSTRRIPSGGLGCNAGELDGGTGVSADDQPVSGGIAFSRISTDGGDVIVKLGGDPLTDRTDLSHDGIRGHR
jgi:hypothetical protein